MPGKSATHGRWSENKIIAENGYVRLRVGRDHPLADPNGYAYEHLVVWCAAGRARPEPGWIIHHEHEVKTDNRLSNLRLISRGDHNRLHNAQRGRDPKTGRLKARAGRFLDGIEHNGMPAARLPSAEG